jgi:ATP-dependent helicase/nuclease subunit A
MSYSIRIVGSRPMSRKQAAAKAPPDQDARELIERRLDINILVEAGAGSGKTESLASRMAAGVVEGRYEVKHMAAVTFTRKAAAELRGRFQLALEGYLKDEPDPARAYPASAGGSRASLRRHHSLLLRASAP